MDAFDDWVLGADVQLSPQGFVSVESTLARCVARLPPAVRADGSKVSLQHPILKTQTLSPKACRLLRETYAYELWCTLVIDGAPLRNQTLLGRIPRMVGSPGCPDLFNGGFFVIDGMERAYVNRECKRFDHPRLYVDGQARAVDIVSLDCPLTLLIENSKRTFKLEFDKKNAKMPIVLLLRALGETRPLHAIFPDDAGEDVLDPDEAAVQFGKFLLKETHGANDERARNAVRPLVRDRLLPFLPDSVQKLEFVLRQLVQLEEFAAGRLEPGDVDAMENKRIDTAGRFVARAACAALRSMWRKLSAALAKDADSADPQRHFKSAQLVTSLCSALKSGDKGASVLPRRASWWESIATARRVTANVPPKSAALGPRLFHSTYYGFYCACETQEGESTGLNRETALFFRVSPLSPTQPWMDDLKRAELGEGESRVRVGHLVVRRDVDFEKAMEWCMQRKRQKDTCAGVWREKNDVVIDVSEGRALRPVWVLPAIIDHRADFDECVQQGRIIWCDADMVLKTPMYIATERSRIEPFHTHVELHPTSLLGPSAACIPFLDHNPGSRNLFGSHVRHQAVGDSNPFDRQRFDTDETSRLWYPQRALCDTEVGRTMQTHEIPGGWNAVVFVLAMAEGQEDAVCVSKRHLQLGAAACETSVSLHDRLKPGEKFGVRKPDPAKHRKIDYRDGLPHVGMTFFPGDLLVAKHRESDGFEISSLKWNRKWPAVVRAAARVSDDTVSVRLAWIRRTDVGDKFASRHGQKGVMGLEFDETRNYFTASGLSPDFVLSPSCLPTRMTIGHLLEMFCGKVNALGTNFDPQHGCADTPTDCSPYSETYSYQKVQSMLIQLGFQRRGHETVFSAKTGMPLQASVFAGPTFMQRLTHFSQPKCHARGRGAVNPQTGQPPKGRSNDGGLRVGEMEVKAKQAYGAAFSLQSAFTQESNGIEVEVCHACEDVRGFTEAGACCVCAGKDRETQIVPRPFMLLIDELKVARIHIRLE